MIYSKHHPDFLTATCLEWKPVFGNDEIKDIVINSLRFLVNEQRVTVYGFVIMTNHFHLIWQLMGDWQREAVQRDFLKYTGQQILFNLKENDPDLPSKVYVGAKDRIYQVYERNSLSVSLWSERVLEQKLRYIHENPVRAGLCKFPEEYKWSSARYYLCNEKNWDFLSHYAG